MDLSLACLFNPIGCVQDAFAAVPISWYIFGAFFVGLVLGAIFRWVGVAGAVVAFLVTIFGTRKFGEPKQQELPFSKDELPKRKKPKRRTLQDLFKGS